MPRGWRADSRISCRMGVTTAEEVDTEEKRDAARPMCDASGALDAYMLNAWSAAIHRLIMDQCWAEIW